MKSIVLLFLTIICLLPTPSAAQAYLVPNIPTAPAARTVYLTGEIDEGSALVLIRQLQELDAEAPGKTIDLHITSPGGSVYAGLAIYDAMQALSSPVKTICDGYCMSMGAFLLIVGNYREASENATVMVHQLSSGFNTAKLADLTNELAEAARLQNIMDDLLAQHSGLSKKKIQELESYDHYLSAKQAKQLGFIDNVLKPRPKLVKLRLNE